jgi:hypothetical protein
MAMINRSAAIVELGESRHELHGMVAVAAWLGVHAYLMSGIRSRVEAFIDWTWTYFTRFRGPQLLDRSDAARINWQEDAQPPSEATTLAAPPASSNGSAGCRSARELLVASACEQRRTCSAGSSWRSESPGASRGSGTDRALNDDDWHIRTQAAEALGALGPEAKAAVPALIDVLQDEDKYFRSHVALALGKIGREAKAAVPALIKALKDHDEDVRRETAGVWAASAQTPEKRLRISSRC